GVRIPEQPGKQKIPPAFWPVVLIRDMHVMHISRTETVISRDVMNHRTRVHRRQAGASGDVVIFTDEQLSLAEGLAPGRQFLPYILVEFFAIRIIDVVSV